ncbi:MAG: hypothetical protein HZB19_03755 [Chloroflexi bacterium]|nr:hypothetical protein [Chloroflexota bacterium]
MALGNRLRYEIDNFLTRGTIALVTALFAVTSCMVLAAAAILVFAGVKPAGSTGELNLAEAIWLAVTRALDPGTFADDTGWSYRLVGFLVTMGGIFLTSALIGVLVSGLDRRLFELRRGRTPVVETGHTLILGWSPQIYTILHELACANRSRRSRRLIRMAGPESRRRACVVILAERDRMEMEEEIRLKAANMLGTRVVCRSGDPLDPDVLQIAHPETTRAIIVLSTGGPHPDLPVGQALLALACHRAQREQRYHIVAAIQRPANLEIMRMIGGEGTQVFLVDRLIACLIAQACRQPGLLPVYEELLRFEGVPIRFAEIQTLAGATYGEAIYRMENAILIGRQSPDGAVQINPPADTRLQPGDQLILLQRVGESVHISHATHLDARSRVMRGESPAPLSPDNLLILGWNQRAPTILEQLSHYAPPGSQVTVCALFPTGEIQPCCAGADAGSLRVTFEQGDPLDRLTLERLAATGHAFIVILSPPETPDVQLADGTTVMTFLHLRDIARKTAQNYSILMEIVEPRSRDLPGISTASDGVISEGIAALVLAQLAEDKDLAPVLVSLLFPGGSHIFLRPVGDYVLPGEPVSFRTLMAAAQCRGETALGYRLLSEAGQDGRFSGVHLNPDRSAFISFSEQDRVIVLAKG